MSQRDTTTLVRRGLLQEAWSSVTSVLFVSHEWPLVAADDRDAADTVGYAFADAFPQRAVLLDLGDLRWFWCALLRRPHLKLQLTPLTTGCLLPSSGPASAPPSPPWCL